MTSSRENLINLKTLQRVDSSIIEILDNACQVAIYKYERKLEKWEGTDIEGSLFLYRRTLSPHYGFIIVNRMSTTNFVESITDDMQFKLQEPYLLYKNHSGDIIGSWFYEHKDLQRISEKIQSIILKAVSPLKRQRRASESESHPTKEENQDIMTLLSEAHQQYIEKANNKRSQLKDANNLNTHSEKKPLEQSVCSVVKKQESEKPAYSFEENYPGSPRRRFMSTGSFDPDRAKYFSRMMSKDHLSPTISKVSKALENPSNEDSSNSQSVKAVFNKPSHYSLQFKKAPPITEASDLTKSYAACSEVHACESNANNPSYPDIQKWRTATAEHSHIHFETIKSAIKFHIQENPSTMLKIHEAYVSSLKSLFNQNSF